MRALSRSRKSFAVPTSTSQDLTLARLPQKSMSSGASSLFFLRVLALVTGRHALPSDDVALPPDDVVGLFISIAGTRSIVRRSLAMDRRALPRTMMGYVIRSSGRHQLALAVLSAAVFGLSSVPLELQRRIVNDAIKNGATETILWLAVAYAGVALLEQALKLALNVYRSWVSEDAVRTLRKTLEDVECATGTSERRDADRHPRRHGGGRGRADRRLRRHGDLRAAAAGRHPGERDRLHGLPRAVDAGAERGLPAAADAVRAADAAGHQPPRRRAHHDPAPASAATSSKAARPPTQRIERVFALNMGIYKIKYRHEPRR